MQRRKKRPVTLIEIMIVILLIGLIGGALAYNMRGSMDQGRAFKTRQNIARVEDALMLKYADGEFASLQEVLRHKDEILEKSPMLKEGKKLLKDGWGNDLKFSIDDDQIKAISAKLKAWDDKQKIVK